MAIQIGVGAVTGVADFEHKPESSISLPFAEFVFLTTDTLTVLSYRTEHTATPDGRIACGRRKKCEQYPGWTCLSSAMSC